MSFLKSSALYESLISLQSLRWMPCQSWAFLRWPGYDGVLRLLVVLLLWSVLCDIHHIPSFSMYPTLRVGDRIITERVSYYIRHPAVNDIVIFGAPSQLLGFRKDDILIKRIVAGAGDLVEVRGGWPYVNGIAKKEEYISERSAYVTNQTINCYRSYLPLVTSPSHWRMYVQSAMNVLWSYHGLILMVHPR